MNQTTLLAESGGLKIDEPVAAPVVDKQDCEFDSEMNQTNQARVSGGLDCDQLKRQSYKINDSQYFEEEYDSEEELQDFVKSLTIIQSLGEINLTIQNKTIAALPSKELMASFAKINQNLLPQMTSQII